MVNSQERHQLSITGFTAEGSGVARLEGLAVFIPGALPGEIVEAAISPVSYTHLDVYKRQV